MPTIYTIGFTQLSLAEFIGLVRKAGVDALIDTRLRNTSQLAGWAKRDDLAFLLRQGFGVAYEHIEPFAPTADLLDIFRAGRDWERYAVAYRALLVERDAAAIGRDLLTRYQAPCLLCSEATPEHCHRRLLAEYLGEQLDGIVIEHLLGAQAVSLNKKRRRS
jgi:uncharacterized protein (DUF488 family)